MAFFEKKPQPQQPPVATPQSQPFQVQTKMYSFNSVSELDDSRLKTLVDEASRELSSRQERIRSKAIEDAKKLLEASGLSLSDLGIKKSGSKKKIPLYRTTVDGKTVEWRGRGPKPPAFKDMTKEQLAAAKVE